MGAAKKATTNPEPAQLSYSRPWVLQGHYFVYNPETRVYSSETRLAVEPDPLLHHLHPPREAHQKDWRGVAELYHHLAEKYAGWFNAERGGRAMDKEIANAQAKAQIERTLAEYARLQAIIDQRERDLRQLKDMIHLLTKEAGPQ